MVKRLSDFSGRAQRSDVKSLKTAVSAMLIVSALAWATSTCFTPWALAEDVPQPMSTPDTSPSIVAAEPAFLSLPALDLEESGDRPKEVHVGDEIHLKTSAAGFDPQGAKLGVPEGSDPIDELGWDLLGDAPLTRPSVTTQPNLPAKDFSFLAVPLKPGKLTLPSLEIKDASGKSVARTNPFTLQVVSAIRAGDKQPQTPADIRPPVGLAFPWWVIVAMAVLVSLLLAALIYGLYRLNLRKRAALPPVEKPPEPILPEDQMALKAIDEVEKQGLLLQGRFKLHYFTVSEILKRYVGQRCEFDALESTSYEMISELKNRRLLSEAATHQLQNLFEHMDRIKFTDYVPSQDEGEAIIREGREFVMSTRRVEGPNAL